MQICCVLLTLLSPVCHGASCYTLGCTGPQVWAPTLLYVATISPIARTLLCFPPPCMMWSEFVRLWVWKDPFGPNPEMTHEV